MQLEKRLGLLDDDHILVRKCSQIDCLNPFHYVVEKKPTVKMRANMSEVAELIELLDLRTLEDLGFLLYLHSFNNGNPLPANPVDFFVACNYKLNKAHKPLLEENLLDEAEI